MSLWMRRFKMVIGKIPDTHSQHQAYVPAMVTMAHTEGTAYIGNEDWHEKELLLAKPHHRPGQHKSINPPIPFFMLGGNEPAPNSCTTAWLPPCIFSPFCHHAPSPCVFSPFCRHAPSPCVFSLFCRHALSPCIFSPSCHPRYNLNLLMKRAK